MRQLIMYVLLSQAAAQQRPAQLPATAEEVCPIIVGLLQTEFVLGISPSSLPRIELRQCEGGAGETIQIVAWEKDAKSPSLVMNTTDFTVIQTAYRNNTFLIETAGATRDQVFVITYEKGKPVLKLKRVTKGMAQVRLTNEAMDVVIPDIYAGDQKPRTEAYHFPFQ